MTLRLRADHAVRPARHRHHVAHAPGRRSACHSARSRAREVCDDRGLRARSRGVQGPSRWAVSRVAGVVDRRGFDQEFRSGVKKCREKRRPQGDSNPCYSL